MSLPDYLLDDDEEVIYCQDHRRYRPCFECEADTIDLYADEKIQDRLDQRTVNHG